MKFTNKKVINLKSKIGSLFILITLILSGVLLVTVPSPVKIDSNRPNFEKPRNKIFTPKSSKSTSGTDFAYADKDIIKGSQTAGILWDEDNIREMDGTHDSTNFAIGNTFHYIEKEVNPATVPVHSGTFGSTDQGGDWWFTDAYKEDDGQYLYLKSTWGNNWPGKGPLRLQWGDYGDFSNATAKHVHKIAIHYEVVPWSDSIFGLDKSWNLAIFVWADNGSAQLNIIDATPVSGHHYVQWWNITEGPVLDRVIEGGFIKYLEVRMGCDEEPFSTTIQYVDFVHIHYCYYKYDIQVDYTLNYGNYSLGNVKKFDLNIQMDETVIGLRCLLYNFATVSWDLIGTIDGTDLINFNILVNGDNYFSGAKNFKVRFEKFDYHDERSWTEYQIKPNMIKLTLYPPEPPDNFEAHNGPAYVNLTWDPVETNGPPLLHYNIYRGEEVGGSKALLTTTITNQYDDYAIVVGTRYYYVVSATTFVGTGENSTEDSGRAYTAPFIEWIKPNNNTNVILPSGDPTKFSFEYEYAELDDAELELDYGAFQRTYNVWGKTSIDIDVLNDYKDGSVTATLIGKNQSIVVDTHIIQLNFVRILVEVESILNQSTKILGKQLYMVLHDPHGDNSYSSFSETTTISLGVGLELISTIGGSFGVGYFGEYCGVETGASFLLENKRTTEMGFDFRYEISDTTTLTSGQVNDDADHIGPGYGDRYWGESWILKYVLNATERFYSNGTHRWENPILYYGIIRGAETFISDADAPPEWKSQNAVYNDSLPVKWLGPFLESGGAPYFASHAVTETQTITSSVELYFGTDVTIKIPFIETHMIFELDIKTYSETAMGHVHEVAYEIYDDDPDDFIAQGIGIDERFGTYIFNSSRFFCETSFPYEHNTYDYRPPDIDYPDIDLDTDKDGLGPTTGDSPKIVVDIFEEYGIQEAVIWYSIDNGSYWDVAYLSERPGQLGTWEGTIPAQAFDTTVLWYIQVWDSQGNNAIRYNYTLLPFRYTVIAKPGDGGTDLTLVLTIGGSAVGVAAIATILLLRRRKRKP